MNRIITFEELEAEIQKQGSHLVFEGHTDLDMTELPNGIQSITVKNGWLAADEITHLPNGITIKAGRNVYLYSLTTIGNSVSITTDYGVWLNSLTSISDDVRIVGNEGIEFANNDHDPKLTEIKLTDNDIVSADVVKFLRNHDICLKISETSLLWNLASKGVKVEIVA
jgi:hypothetical protein